MILKNYIPLLQWFLDLGEYWGTSWKCKDLSSMLFQWICISVFFITAKVTLIHANICSSYQDPEGNWFFWVYLFKVWLTFPLTTTTIISAVLQILYYYHLYHSSLPCHLKTQNDPNNDAFFLPVWMTLIRSWYSQQ